MGSILASWDKKASLPLLKELMKSAVPGRTAGWLKRTPANADRNARVVPGQVHRAPARSSATRRCSTSMPRGCERRHPKCWNTACSTPWQPLLAHSDHPALASAAQWLFNDPKSPWVPLLPEARAQQAPPFQDLFASPLIVVAGFRVGCLHRPGGQSSTRVRHSETKRFHRTQDQERPDDQLSAGNLNLEGVAVGVEYPFRRCDYLASNLSELEGCPRFDLFWPEARRDEGVAACAAYLKRFGASFTAKPPPGDVDYPGPRAHLEFPTLGKPATARGCRRRPGRSSRSQEKARLGWRPCRRFRRRQNGSR